MKIIFSKKFDKSYHKLNLKIQKKIDQVLLLFRMNPFDSKLRNHALSGVLFGLRSIDITGDLRIIFKELSSGKYEIVELVNVGTHNKLYG